MFKACLLCFMVFFLVPGCNPSVRDMMQQTFAEDPAVVAEYQPDGSHLYKTRNIVLDAGYAHGSLNSLVMLVAFPDAPSAQDSVALIKFRSVSPDARFIVRRNLILNIAGEQHDAGECTYESDRTQKGKVTEDLTAAIPREMVSRMAKADTLKGTIGEMAFQVAGDQLMPVRALLDTVQAR